MPRRSLALVGAAVAVATMAACGTAPTAPSTTAGAGPATTSPATVDPTSAAQGSTKPKPTAQSLIDGSYIDYDDYSADPSVFAEGGNVVLFFHASWCPTCQAAEANLTSQPVPDGLTVVKTDFDTMTELRQKYGVTVQHTFVQIDAGGAQLAKWSGSTSAAEIADQVQ